MKNYLISEDLKNSLLSYLANKPYVEVTKIINELFALRPFVPPKEEKKPE